MKRSPNRRHGGFVELGLAAVGQDVDYSFDAACTKHWGEHADAMTICPRRFVRREGLRFGTHDNCSHLGRDLDDAVHTVCQIFGLGFCFAAGFGQMLVADPGVLQ